MKPLPRLVWLGFCLPLFAVWLQASGPLAATQDPRGEFAPRPELIDFTRARKIPIEKIEFAPDADGARKGDRVTMLIALVQRGVERQWLATLEAAYNPNVANAFFRAGAIEAWGCGIQRMFQACREGRRARPAASALRA